MAIQIQLRQGTTTEHNTFTGAVGELTYDTEKKQLRVHDGSTVGGKPILDPTDTTNAVTQATETTAGKAKIATTAIAQAGTNDTDFITALKLANTRQSVWVNKTGMLFGTTYMNTSLYEKEISFLSGLANGLLLTAKVTFKNLNTHIETIVYFGCVSNWTGGIASSANFVVPPTTSFKIEIVRTNDLSTVVNIAVNKWSERYYV